MKTIILDVSSTTGALVTALARLQAAQSQPRRGVEDLRDKTGGAIIESEWKDWPADE